VNAIDPTVPTAVLPVGTRAPGFRLPSAQGPEVALEDYRGRPVVLWFSRGLSCPFCRRHMAQLRLGYSAVREGGAEILQVTWNSADEARLYFKRHPLAFPYLCDPDLRVHALYGVAVVAPPLTAVARTIVRSTAVVVADRLLHGERTESPGPLIRRIGFGRETGQAVYIVDRDGVIRRVFPAGAIAAVVSGGEIARHLGALA
jgi:peroxiredoxin